MDDKKFWSNPGAISRKFYETFPMDTETVLNVNDPDDLEKISLYDVYVDTLNPDPRDLPKVQVVCK